MTFSLLPTVDLMLDLYEQPRTFERFQEYLKALQGDAGGDLALPIHGFNPMAKEQVAENLATLKALGAEQVMGEALLELNQFLKNDPRRDNFQVALNLADDLKGGWTNRYTTDYDSKFNFRGIFSRRFCTPFFWTSEMYSPQMIRQRTLEYAFRSLRWLDCPNPQTLGEHISQEQFAATHTAAVLKTKLPQPSLDSVWQKHEASTDYFLIFNYLYGEEAAVSLGFPAYSPGTLE